MSMPWVGVRRLALVLGSLGAVAGLIACIVAFNDIHEKSAHYDMVQNALRSGTMVSHADGSLWWKDRAEQEHPYVNGVPERRPSENDVSWTVLLPFGGFLIPWGGVMLLAWIVAGFVGQRGSSANVQE